MFPLVLLAVASLGALGATSANTTNAAIAWASLGLTSYLSCLFVSVFFNSKSFGLYEIRLGGWFLGYAIVAFGLATFSIIGRQIPGYVIDNTKVPQALALIALAFTLWAIGYALGRERIFQMPFQWGKEMLTARLSSEVRSANVLLLVFGVGVIADILTVVLLGSYGYLGDSPTLTVGSASWYAQPLAIVSGLKSAALFGLSVRVFVSRTDRFSKHLLPVLALALAMSMVTGMKESFVTALIGVAIPFLMGYGRRRILWIAAFVLVFVFVVTPIVAGIRQDVTTSNNGRLGVLTSLSLSVSKLFGGSYFTADPNSPPTITTAERLREIDNLAVIIQKTPGEIPYRPISEVLLAPFTGLIPRLLWPDKPVRISGYEFYRNYYGGLGVSASAVTLEGSLYLYGGTVVLVIGMFLVGLLMRAVEGALNAKNDLHGALLFMVVVEVVVKEEADVASFLAGIVVFVLSWLLGAHMIFRRKANPLTTRKSSNVPVRLELSGRRD